MTPLDRLKRAFDRGHFGYEYGPRNAAEPAALGALALHAHGEDPRAPLDWLSAQHGEDGGVPVLEGLERPCWPTALALWAWAEAGDGRDDASKTRAAAWLSRHHGEPFESGPTVGHDSSLVGWSWVDATHSWVEPTAYAVIALRAAGHADRADVREGVQLLLDRCLPGGGWNYGNTRVLANTLRPFPATTGLALLALVGETRGDEVDRSIAYLRSVVRGTRSPVSLSWAVLALRAWGEPVAEPRALFDPLIDAPGRRPADPVHDALMAWAIGASDE